MHSVHDLVVSLSDFSRYRVGILMDLIFIEAWCRSEEFGRMS